MSTFVESFMEQGFHKRLAQLGNLSEVVVRSYDRDPLKTILQTLK